MPVKSAFEPEIVPVAMSAITPVKSITDRQRKSRSYPRIAASLAHIGLIEPLVIYPAGEGKYLLLDGHVRFDILAAAGQQVVNCLIATDNDSYTYNRRVNSIPPIGQHHMILRALTHVSEDRIASALSVAVATIREKRDLLKGVCPEAAEILKNERVSAAAFAALRKMKPLRQIDVARLMIAAHKFSGQFARALLEGTREELLAVPPKGPRRVTSGERSILEQETDELLKHAERIKANYGNDVLNLTAACKYAERILANARVQKYIGAHHADVLAALQKVLADCLAEQPPPTARQMGAA